MDEKKMMLCASVLSRNFSVRAPELFSFPDTPRLTAMADNVLPAVLRAVGVLIIAPALGARIDACEALPAGSAEEVDLRAGAVVACERIVAAVSEITGSTASLTEADLDQVLWAKGKEPALRKLERHATRDTYYY